MSQLSIDPSGYVLGKRSLNNLSGVHPDLVRVVKYALNISLCDFTVTEGSRTIKRQRQLVKAKKSKTMNSRHLPKIPQHTPEFGRVSHAVDLGAWVEDTLSWDWRYYFEIANAMRQASIDLAIPINWGGCWSFLLEYESAEAASEAYLARKRAQGKKPYRDGPHFELNWEAYPV